jgi:hypothetical protein
MNTKSFSPRGHLSAGSALKVCPFEPSSLWPHAFHHPFLSAHTSPRPIPGTACRVRTKSRGPLNATTLRLTDRAQRADTRYPTTG